LSKERTYLIDPRDILLSTATLIGFILTAFGIITTRAESTPEILKLSGILLWAVVTFVASVIFATAASLSRRSRLWTSAQVLYIMGWVSTAILISALLLNVAYRIDVFSISIPNIELQSRDVGLVVTIIVAGAVGALVNYFLSYQLGNKIRLMLSQAEGFRPTPPSGSPTEIRLFFLDKVIRIERMLRDLVKVDTALSARQLSEKLQRRETISPQLAMAIDSLWKVRNSIVHGVDVPDRDVVSATELADYALSVLSKLSSTA
jgi:hypothetical protein